MFATVVVPLDSTPESMRALKPASVIAKATGADLVATSVVYDAADRTRTRIELRQAIAEYGVHVTSVVVYVDAYSVSDGLRHLLSKSERILIVAATQGHSHSVGIVGSVSEHLLHQWPEIPMLLVGPHCNVDSFGLEGPIVACVDGTSESEAVVGPVSELALGLGLDSWVLSVLDSSASEAALTPARGGSEALPETGQLQRVASQIRTNGVDEVNWEMLHGRNPAKSIVEFSDSLGASIIAVATRNRGGLSRLALGSVAMETVAHSSTPVLATHSPG